MESHPIGAGHLVVEAEIERATPNLRLRMGVSDYRLEALDGDVGPELTFQPEDEYFILDVPKELGALMPPFKDAGFALISQSIRDEPKQFGATIEQDSQVLWGEFVLEGDKIRFEVAYPDSPLPEPIFVGDDDLNRANKRTAGSVVGVFREA